MKCGEWSVCDLDFCKYFKEGEECVKANSKVKREPTITESEVDDGDEDEIC